jgi:hypothetical protein
MITAGWHGDAIAGSGNKKSLKEDTNVVDDFCGTGNFVAVGVGKWLYYG